MDDDESYEQFDVKQSDIDFALNPGRMRFQSKEEATYGIWADEDSDDDTKRPSFGNKRKANYSTPVSFVSGGIKVGEKIVNEAGASTKTVEVDSSFTFKPLATKKTKKQAGANVLAGMRTSTTAGAHDPKVFGDWMKGGKGSVIANMMSKMGYKMGEGLGKDGSGIVEPVQAAVRQGRGAVGAYGKEATGPKFGESAAEAQKRIAAEGQPGYQAEEKEQQVPKRSWKKNDKIKTKYRTIDEVIQEGGKAPMAKGAQSNIKIIDMTGKEQKVYRGYDSFSLRTRAEADDDDRQNFDVKELRHNLNLLVDMTEQNIRRTNDQVRSLRDQSTALGYDVTQSKTLLVNEEEEARRMKEVHDLIEQFSTGMSSSTMPEIQSLFLKLKADFPHEYRLFNLETVAIPLVLPLLNQYFAKWQPLERGEESFGLDLINEWKEILVDGDKSVFSNNIHSLEQISAFDRLLWEGWLPSLRRAALAWDPRDQMEEMLIIMEKWLPVLPEWMKENVLEQVIIPRIVDRVTNWDPLKDGIPVHSWIIPWIEPLGDRLQPVLSQIRQKLAKVIREKWNPSDVSAMRILQPWIAVWTPSTMSAFLGQQIIPKIERFLERMEISPIEFREEEWKAVVAWLELISPDIMASILTKFFFPRWFSVLNTWLDAPGVNLQQVRLWFQEWRDRIPPVLAEFPTIKENMRRGLVAMSHALQGTRIVGAPMPAPIQMEVVPPPPPPAPLRDLRAQQQQLSLKDVVEMSAARHGLTYVPQRDRQRDGRQVFWFGNVSIYLDRGMVFCMDPQDFTWRPVSMEELLSLAGAGV